MVNQQIVCPLCNHAERVSKVSVKHSEGFSTGSVTSQSHLSVRLSPPPHPQSRFGSHGFYSTMYALSGGCFLIALYTFFSYPNAGCSVISLICGTIIAFRIADAKQEEQKYKVELPAWERAMERYDRLYYCELYDIVFDPNVQGYVRLEQMKDYLYDTTRA